MSIDTTDGPARAAADQEELSFGGTVRPGYLEHVTRILRDGPRDEDFLPVTDEVRRKVERNMAYARARAPGMEFLPEIETRQLVQHLLIHHHPLVNILYMTDDRGVIVLAVGLDEVYRFKTHVPYELWRDKGVVSDAPQPFC